MKIILDNISKKYNNKWILKNFSQEFSNNLYGITGLNGSGKSTLIKIIFGYISPNSGKVIYYNKDSIIENSIGIFSFAAPYQHLIEELTLTETINFHFQFLNPISKIKKEDILNKIELEEYKNLKIHDFSSGMKQKLKLGLALFSNTKFTLLDEPCTNLDKNGISWYHNTIDETLKFKKIIIATNNRVDINRNDTTIIDLDKIKNN